MSDLAIQAAAARIVREIRASSAQLAPLMARLEMLETELQRLLPLCTPTARLLLQMQVDAAAAAITAALFPSCVPVDPRDTDPA